MILDSVDITQLISLVGFASVIARLWVLHKARDKEMKDNAVADAQWRLSIEHKIELLKTQGCKDTDGIEKTLQDFRLEVKEDHTETKKEISLLRDEIKQVEQTGREGRDKLYQLIEKIRDK